MTKPNQRKSPKRRTTKKVDPDATVRQPANVATAAAAEAPQPDTSTPGFKAGKDI